MSIEFDDMIPPNEDTSRRDFLRHTGLGFGLIALAHILQYENLLAAPSAASYDLSPKLGIVVAIPNHQLPTEEARAWLPPVVNLKAATRNLARFGFLLEGLRTGDSDALRFAAGDEMHEPFRAALAPFTDELMMAAQRAGAFHTCWSGAGPSALAFCNVGRVEVVSMALSGQLGDNGTVMVLEPTADGFR